MTFPRAGFVRWIRGQGFVTGHGFGRGHGRAEEMKGDRKAARTHYQDFLLLWKDADPEIPILKQAKLEYANLR